MYLASCLASVRQLTEAGQHVRLALALRPHHLPSLLLLLLLLAAQGDLDEAIVVRLVPYYPTTINSGETIVRHYFIQYPNSLAVLY